MRAFLRRLTQLGSGSFLGRLRSPNGYVSCFARRADTEQMDQALPPAAYQ